MASLGQILGLVEAFYDPLGSFNDGRFGGPIGGHSDHVHVSDVNPQGILQAIGLAQKYGLSVRENPYVDHVDPVHTKGSYHYRTFPGLYNGKSLGEAIDVSGSSDAMARYYRAVTGGGSQASVPMTTQNMTASPRSQPAQSGAPTGASPKLPPPKPSLLQLFDEIGSPQQKPFVDPFVYKPGGATSLPQTQVPIPPTDFVQNLLALLRGFQGY